MLSQGVLWVKTPAGLKSCWSHADFLVRTEVQSLQENLHNTQQDGVHIISHVIISVKYKSAGVNQPKIVECIFDQLNSLLINVQKGIIIFQL